MTECADTDHSGLEQQENLIWQLVEKKHELILVFS